MSVNASETCQMMFSKSADMQEIWKWAGVTSGMFVAGDEDELLSIFLYNASDINY